LKRSYQSKKRSLDRCPPGGGDKHDNCPRAPETLAPPLPPFKGERRKWKEEDGEERGGRKGEKIGAGERTSPKIKFYDYSTGQIPRIPWLCCSDAASNSRFITGTRIIPSSEVDSTPNGLKVGSSLDDADKSPR
jgi:hypothetical protein